MAFDSRPLDAVLAEATDSGRIVGAVVAVAHRGDVRLYAAGLDDREAGLPMAPGATFRLASLTKAVVCVAALVLVDRGVITLDDPVTRYLPWFTPRLPSGGAPAITLRQLMTHSAGLGYGFGQPGGGDYFNAGISDGLDDSGLTLEENLRRLAAAPLLHPPGSKWSYSLAIDVLGAILECACDTPLGEVLADLVMTPLGLGMAFVASPGMALVTPYAEDSPSPPARMGAHHVLPFGQSEIRYSPGRAWRSNAYPSGGTGLIGTAADYLAFLEAIRVGKGAILSDAMAKAFVTEAVPDLTVGFPGSGLGWGLGVAVLRDPATTGSPLSPGSWQWGGVYGHAWWVDPVSELSAVLLTNTAVAGMAGPFPDAVKRAVHRGL